MKKQAKRQQTMDNQRQTTAGKPLLVQFFHPGRECPVKMVAAETFPQVPWTVKCDEQGCGTHCKGNTRRLIRHKGRYVDETGKLRSGELAFWGEWEADTVVQKMEDAPDDRLYAHWVHSVRPPRPKRKGLLDTDPCVFGQTFKYCFCQQRKNNSLRRLPPGSLVLFGSTVEGCFCLDTVFVVDGEGVRYVAPAASNLSVSKEYRELTLKWVASGEHTFYRGKTFKAGKPYSFVPARRFKKGDPECRRRFKLDVGKINRAQLAGSSKKLKPDLRRFHLDIPVDRRTLEKVWEEIRRQVQDADFLPAVHFDWPEKT